jgi:hypothetical protein
MPLRTAMLPAAPGDIWKAIKALQQDVKELRAARRLEAASIGAGALTITGNGSIQVLSADGTTVRLWISADPQGLLVRDAAGNTLILEDPAGQGLARPYFDVPMYPAKSGNMLTTTSAAYEILWRGYADTRNPRLAASGWILAGAGSTGNLRVKVNGTQIGSTVVATTSLAQWTVGPIAHGAAINTDMTVDIEAQLTGGSGPITVGIHHVRGEQN